MIEHKIKQIVFENIDKKKSLQDLDLDSKLADIGVNSILFIKIILAIETEFNIEFGDEELDFTKYPDIKSMVSYVQNKKI